MGYRRKNGKTGFTPLKITAHSVERVADREKLNAKRYPLSAKTGFTLVEVLMAMFIAMVGLVGLFQMFSFGYFRLKTTKNHLSAIHCCQDKMELILSLDYSTIVSLYGPGVTESVTIDYGEDLSSEDDDLVGQREVQLTDWLVGLDTVGKEISVTVSWHYRGKDLSEAMVSAVSTEH